jgi:hypothetical protein
MIHRSSRAALVHERAARASQLTNVVFVWCRKGTTTPGVRKQVRVPSVRDYAAALDDGFSWRKYGQKEILGAKYPRSAHVTNHLGNYVMHTSTINSAGGIGLL